MITVFYDGSCPLCSKEIRYYQRIGPNDVFLFEDISVSTHLLNAHNINQIDALKILHVTDTNNTVHRGVDAFIIIWQALRYWKLLAFIIKQPLIKHAATIAYTLFAKWRFKHLMRCDIK